MKKVKDDPAWGPTWRGKEKFACLECGHKIDAASGAAPGHAMEKPKPGDIAVCIRCGAVMLYAEDGESFRAPTREEKAEVLADPVVMKAIAAIAKIERTH